MVVTWSIVVVLSSDKMMSQKEPGCFQVLKAICLAIDVRKHDIPERKHWRNYYQQELDNNFEQFTAAAVLCNTNTVAKY